MTATLENETQAIDRNAEKFREQEKRFIGVELALAKCRAFIEKHRLTLAPFNWSCFGWDNEITFSHYCNEAKAIARAFGADGWTREHDRWSCGSVDWKKEIDGMFLIIKGAESIKPKLNEQVRL